LKVAVEWISPWPLAAAVSGAGAATSLVMGVESLKCASQSEAAYSPALGA
jgi:hypothetical protein